MATKKQTESYFVEEAAKLLGQNWQLVGREEPDFIVTCDSHEFALEVTQVFVGKTTKKGSQDRRAESNRADWLDAIRAEYAKHSTADLSLKYLGAATDAAGTDILKMLLAEQFDDKSTLHQLEKRVADGKLWATKALRPEWTFMSDGVGWVSRDGAMIQQAIQKKSVNLPKYSLANRDVRLLVVADRLKNSGKLTVDESFTPALHGFKGVYFLSYPDSVACFGECETRAE